MKKLIILILCLCAFVSIQAQEVNTDYEPSKDFPFGRINPVAPQQIKDFAPMIGICDCQSLSRNPDGSWQDTIPMIWKFKYIMNGTAVQDEVWRSENRYAGSIRQYQADSSKWVVTYFSYPAVSTSPGVWLGGKVGKDIILKMDQKAPNGTEGYSRLTFYDMTEEGFNWKGEWVSKDETITYPFWMIYCQKRSPE